jgi:hypothetical protein
MSINAVNGSFTAVGASAAFRPEGTMSVNAAAPFNISIWGTFVGTVRLERSFDGGATWLPKTAGGSGSIYTYTSPVSEVDEEPEAAVAYRLNCTSYTSGTINYRLSQ